jgi:integrase
MEVKQIGDYEIDQFKAYKSKSNLSPKTINNILTTLNVCLKTAKKWKLLPELPEIKLLTTPKSAYKFLTREQLNLLLANVDGMLRDMIIIGAKCGLRFGEIIALTWDSIDLETGEIEINKAVCRGQLGTTKSNRIRTVWAFNETLEMLRRRKQMSNGNNFVFVGETGGFPGQTNCRVHLHRACDKVGLKRVGFHPLRHSYASHANNINANPVGVQQLMGHASFSTTLNYIHTNKEFLRETARLINEETAKNEVKEKSTPNNNYHNFTTIVNSQINSPTRARTHDNNIRLK